MSEASHCVPLGAYQALALFAEDLGDQFTHGGTKPRTLRAVLTTAMDEPFKNRSVTALLSEDAQRSIIDALATNLDEGPEMTDLTFRAQQCTEHEAWLAVVSEMRTAGVGDIEAGGAHERLHDAITAWGEELAQLRMMDPDPAHAEAALKQRREKYLET